MVWARRVYSHNSSLVRELGPQRYGILLTSWALKRYPMLMKTMAFASTPLRKPGLALEPILIYQMAKVGSTSLLYSLQYAYLKAGHPDVPLHHVHALTNLQQHEQAARLANDSELLATVQEYQQLLHDFTSQPARQWKIVSLVRDPIARHISDYFHHIGTHLPGWRESWEAGRLSVDEVREHFLTVEDHAPNWFDAELRHVTGIDVFARPFNHLDGYTRYDHPRSTLIVLRLEDLQRASAPAMSQLLGLKNFKLYQFNSRSGAAAGEMYRQFLTRALPSSYVEAMYETRFAGYFYTAAERESFTRKRTGGH
jgi:hypothetical protein